MTEQQSYEVLEVFPGFEVRRYQAHLVARVTVRAGIVSACGSAFGYLFGYLNGENTPSGPRDDPVPRNTLVAPSSGALSSSASLPSARIRQGVRIPMTAPVLVQPGEPLGCVTVAFILPGWIRAGGIPEPSDPAVSIIGVPEARGAAAVFSGRWTARTFSVRAGQLEAAVREAGLTALGPARFALFDPPYKPGFLRRNEVIQTVG